MPRPTLTSISSPPGSHQLAYKRIAIIIIIIDIIVIVVIITVIIWSYVQGWLYFTPHHPKILYSSQPKMFCISVSRCLTIIIIIITIILAVIDKYQSSTSIRSAGGLHQLLQQE